jgi:ribosomal protein L37AE/L43A
MLVPAQLRFRPRRGRKTKAKVVRAATVIIDQSVACPSCGNTTQLSKMRTLECMRCGREVTADEALRALEMSEPVP